MQLKQAVDRVWQIVNLGKSGTVAVMLVLVAGIRLAQLSDGLTQETAGPGFETEAHALFSSLLATGLMTVDNQQRLQLPAQDYALAMRFNQHTVIRPENEKLLERLTYSQAGKVVRREVAFWNHARFFAAVRDNAPASSEWQASDGVWGGHLALNDLVPLDYGYVNGGQLQPGFNAWASASHDGTIVFEKNWTLAKPLTVKLHLIGQPDLAGLPYPATLQACLDNGKACLSTPIAKAEAFQLTVALPAGKPVLRLPIKPVPNPGKRVDGVMVYQKSTATDGSPVYAWQNLTGTHRHVTTEKEGQAFDFTVLSHDGEVLALADGGQASKYTLANGLLPLIGYDRKDRYSLSGLVARSNLPHNGMQVHLTLDARLQALAQKHLSAMLATVDPSHRYESERRAAVVLLDPHTGAIKAAVSYPNPPANIGVWDRLSFAKVYPNLDPFKVAAWQTLNRHYAPGSSFKPITALAAIQAANQGRDDLQFMVKGLNFENRLIGTNLTELTGFNPESYSYADAELGISRIHNFGNSPLKASLNKPLRATECANDIGHSQNIGLREALRDSSNIWFARLGVMTDQNNLQEGGKNTYLSRTAASLGFGQALALSAVPALKRVTDSQGHGDVLNALTGQLSLETEANNSASALQRLSQNSIGQGVAVTPLQMARVISAVATDGKIPTPYLIERWDGSQVSPPEPHDLSQDSLLSQWLGGDLGEQLRQGLKAVPEVGTASEAFKKHYPEGRCRVFGKTGTAQIAEGNHQADFNSAWFIGWREQPDSSAPDISFACMVTHTYVNGKQNGGDVCAPIIAGLLKDMDKNTQTNTRGGL